MGWLKTLMFLLTKLPEDAAPVHQRYASYNGYGYRCLEPVAGKLKPKSEPNYSWLSLFPKAWHAEENYTMRPKPGSPLFCSAAQVQGSMWPGEWWSLPQLLKLLLLQIKEARLIVWRLTAQKAEVFFLLYKLSTTGKAYPWLPPWGTLECSSASACTGEKALLKPSSLLRLNGEYSEETCKMSFYRDSEKIWAARLWRKCWRET